MTSDNDLYRVKQGHDAIHQRLINWGRWCSRGRGTIGVSPMFRGYKAPKYRNAVDELKIPIDGLDASGMERAVFQLPEQHRDATRWQYVYSDAGVSLWKIMRLLGVNRIGFIELVDDSRAMLRNRIDTATHKTKLPSKFDPASAVPASRCEA